MSLPFLTMISMASGSPVELLIPTTFPRITEVPPGPAIFLQLDKDPNKTVATTISFINNFIEFRF